MHLSLAPKIVETSLDHYFQSIIIKLAVLSRLVLLQILFFALDVHLHVKFINLYSTSQAWLFLRGGCGKRMMAKNLKISSCCRLGAGCSELWMQFSCWTFNLIFILGRVFYFVLGTRHSLLHILSFVHFPVVLDCCRNKDSDKWATKCHKLLIGILIFLIIFIDYVFKPPYSCWICKLSWLPFQCSAVCAFADDGLIILDFKSHIEIHF